MKRTLVIVDMQRSFPTSLIPRVVEACTREVIKAKNRGDAILLVEYEEHGTTNKAITNPIRTYSKKLRVIKPCDDGSHFIREAIQAAGFPNKYLTFCGVNSECCIALTVEHTSILFPETKLVIVADAVNGSTIHNDYGATYKVDTYPHRKAVLAQIKQLPATITHVRQLTKVYGGDNK